MTKARRNASSETDYARRNRIAREAGWTSTKQEQVARRKFKESPIDVQGKYGRFLVNKGRSLDREEERKAFRAFWQGLIDPRYRENTDKTSPKAEWFVEWLDLDVFDHDYDKWQEMYGESQ
jgi:hypothetical protein